MTNLLTPAAHARGGVKMNKMNGLKNVYETQ